MENSTHQRIRIRIRTRQLMADSVTPVSLYRRLRRHYSEPVLLESNDFSSAEDCHSLLCFEPIATFSLKNKIAELRYPKRDTQVRTIDSSTAAAGLLYDFIKNFDIPSKEDAGINGLFGHCNFDAVRYFDTLPHHPEKRSIDLPDIKYNLYRFVISIDHFRDEMTVLENIPEGEDSQMEAFLENMNHPATTAMGFSCEGGTYSNLEDGEFKRLVSLGKEYCQQGEVFQIVFSRRFSQAFQGDDFQVYRALRSINPSPYLFYFDMGDYRIFGSSPEAQLIIKDGKARVNPIAGTFRRTGNTLEDQRLAAALRQDPKENAEHIMLVDLARNDLGRHCENVRVKDLKSIKFYSHVIHMVSEVEGVLPAAANPIQVFADTFPAGTLSGAPKYRALELIGRHEKDNRGFYGGGIGFIHFNGDMNQAIIIRSFLSLEGILHFQAGAGIVVGSQEESELQEVNHKLGALKKALERAEEIGG